MSALLNSLIRAIGGVAVSVIIVALVWTIYINRAAVADIAAPVVDPLIDSAARNNTAAEERAR